ncbi:Integrase family protein [[Clostridium] ultunense Esp]|nr:Integrase family protein [[Clostridium] ultunense Esp]
MAGSIQKRGDNVWLVRVYMGLNSEGKRKYHNKTIHGNKKDAEKYLNSVLRERDLGTFVEPTKKTVRAYLEEWLEQAAKKRVSERTYQDYRGLLERYVYPVIGEHKLSKLKPLDIQKLINDMHDKGITRTTQYTVTVLKQALKQAVKWQLIPRNPAELVEIPRKKAIIDDDEDGNMRVLTKEEAIWFKEAASSDPYYALFMLMLTTGVRPGEAYALKWDEVDLENGRIFIKTSLYRTKDGWKLKEPKTPGSRRNITIPPEMINILKEHKEKQEERKKKKAESYKDYGFVFTADNGEPITHRNLVKRHFKPILELAGLPPIRIYDLRHTCATLLLLAGISPKVVAERLGHASVNMTLNRYSHVLPDMQQKASDALQEMLF